MDATRSGYHGLTELRLEDEDLGQGTEHHSEVEEGVCQAVGKSHGGDASWLLNRERNKV